MGDQVVLTDDQFQQMLVERPELNFHLQEVAHHHLVEGAVENVSTGMIHINPDLINPSPFETPVQNIENGIEVFEGVFDFFRAEAAINEKAGQLGGLPGTPTSTVDWINSGYVRRFTGADIYYSKRTGAHEVHGDIRAKYDALRGAEGVLGFPTTDETGTPDGVGRFNHFEGGSIYWTPSTGPMMVRGPVRDVWANQGWESGPLGYPVADHHVRVIINPTVDPMEAFSVFQNGAVFSLGGQAAPALIAELPGDKLTRMVRQFFDQALHEADSDLGIEGGISLIQVTDWGWGFWSSRPRQVTYSINGFYSAGIPLVADPTFNLEVTFQYGLSWPANRFVEPWDKTLVVHLTRLKVSTSGVGHGTLHDRLKSGILDRFREPLPIRGIPAEARLLGILTTPTGGLQFLLAPDIPNPIIGRFRQVMFQRELDNIEA